MDFQPPSPVMVMAMLTGSVGTASIDALSMYDAKPVFDHSYVARVIYAETAICGEGERWMVASVIKNRIGKKEFGGAGAMRGVVEVPKAFSCVDDNRNGNWVQSVLYAESPPLNDLLYRRWLHSLHLAHGDFKPYPEVVYYHDKTIVKPDSWDNKWFVAALVCETPHFKFYRTEARRVEHR